MILKTITKYIPGTTQYCDKKYKTSDCQLNEWYRHEQIYDDYNNAIQTYKDKLYLKSMEEWFKNPTLKINQLKRQT